MANETNLYVGTDGDFDITNAAQWSDGAVAAGDNGVIPKGTSGDITDNLAATGTLFASFNIEKGNTIDMATNLAPLQIDTSLATIGGTGDMFLEIDDCSLIQVVEAGSSGTGSDYSLNLYGDGHAGATILVIDVGTNGRVALGTLLGTSRTSYFKEIHVRSGVVFIGGDVATGAAAEVTKLVISGGTVYDYTDYDNIIMTGGTLFKYEGYVTANITLSGSARCIYNSADVNSGDGVAGVVYVNAGARFDLSNDERAKVIAAVELSSGSTWLDPFLCVTYTAAPKLKGCGVGDVTLDLGSNISVAPVAI